MNNMNNNKNFISYNNINKIDYIDYNRNFNNDEFDIIKKLSIDIANNCEINDKVSLKNNIEKLIRYYNIEFRNSQENNIYEFIIKFMKESYDEYISLMIEDFKSLNKEEIILRFNEFNYKNEIYKMLIDKTFWSYNKYTRLIYLFSVIDKKIKNKNDIYDYLKSENNKEIAKKFLFKLIDRIYYYSDDYDDDFIDYRQILIKKFDNIITSSL